MTIEFVRCPKCGGDTFKITRERLSDRMFASHKLTVTCIQCGHSESLYRLGEDGLEYD